MKLLKNLFKRKPGVKCQKCGKPVRRFFVIKRFGMPLCPGCNTLFRKTLKFFDKVHSRFSDKSQEKCGELFGKFLENKFPKDFKIDYHIYYETKDN
jgi:hypothetical protein